MDYEDEGYLHYPELSIRRFFFFFLNLHFQLKSEARINQYNFTFCRLSLLPNGEFRGELLRVYVLGLFASEGIPSLLDSVLHFR